MPFKSNNLNVVAYANGFTLWHYHSKEDSSFSCNYFSNAGKIIRNGDLIICAAKDRKKTSIFLAIQDYKKNINTAPMMLETPISIETPPSNPVKASE